MILEIAETNEVKFHVCTQDYVELGLSAEAYGNPAEALQWYNMGIQYAKENQDKRMIELLSKMKLALFL